VDLGGRVEGEVLVVVLTDLVVADVRRRLVLSHHALHDEPLSEVGDLVVDLGVPVVARLLSLLVEEVVHDEVLDELPLPIRRGEIRPRRRRQALELASDVVAGEGPTLVAGDDRAPVRGGRLGARLIAAAATVDERHREDDDRKADAVGGSHTAECHTPASGGSQFCAIPRRRALRIIRESRSVALASMARGLLW